MKYAVWVQPKDGSKNGYWDRYFQPTRNKQAAEAWAKKWNDRESHWDLHHEVREYPGAKQ